MSTYRQVLDDRTQELVPVVLQIFIFIYVVIACSHYLLLPEPVGLPMAMLAGASVLIGIMIQRLRKKDLIRQNSELVLVLLLLIMGINSGAHLFVTADVKQTTNFIFVIAIAGYILPTPKYFYGTLALLVVGWLILVTFDSGWSDDGIHFVFAMAMASMFSVFLHTLRRNQLMQLFEMENAVEKLKQSQIQTTTAESMLQTLMDNTPAGIVVRDEQTKILFANEVARELLGIDSRSFLGLKANEDGITLCDSQGDPLRDEDIPVNRVLREGKPIVNEIVGTIRGDGTLRWGLVNAFTIVPDESTGRVVILSFVDVTERISAEMQLRDSEERAHAILDSVLEGIVTVDQEGMITLINPAARTMTGYSGAEALGLPLTSVVRFVEHEADSYTGLQEDAAPVRQGTLKNREDDELAVELVISEITSQDEKLGEVVTLRDVRDQLRLEQERASIDKMSSVGVLAGGIAHDFNNLLTAIYGNLTLAESTINDPDKALKLLRRSSESIQLATNLTNQLLTFAKGSDPVRDIVDVEKLVRQASQFALSGSSLAVRFDIEPDVLAVEVDAGQMQQAISNIVLNAKQAQNDHGLIDIHIQNKVVNSGQADFVEVVIADDGPGIEAEALTKIFDPYFTTKETGNGLGLATTHSIIVKHGGSISVDSTPGSGTRFTLLLPAAQEMYAEEADSPRDATAISDALHILVMDDEEVVLETISALLESLGHIVTGVRDGAQAISAYASAMKAGQTFDLVIMDLTIVGGMGGKEAAEKVLDLDPQARLIVSSGYSAGSEMARFRDFGFKARLEKPFKLQDLNDILTEVMR